MAQTTWVGTNATPGFEAYYCYDAGRDRVVYVDSFITAERDPTGFWSVLANTVITPQFLGGGLAYDRTRSRVVCNLSGDTWLWDGSNWTMATAPPPSWAFRHVFSHERRGTVMAFGGTGIISNDLYEWNGVSWVLVPTTNPPPRQYVSATGERTDYMSAAYDARRDKIVLFGSGLSDVYGFIANPQMTIWEWDVTNGWTNPTVAGAPVGNAAKLFFDSHRGMLTAHVINIGVPPTQLAEWDGGPSWRLVTPVLSPPPDLAIIGSPGHDSLRGMTFATWARSNPTVVWTVAYETVNPARLESLVAGCAGSAGAPLLKLSGNWMRAWLGQTLSVDLTNLPQSMGFLAVGWSNTSAGPIPLPHSLAPYGMPGCFARVSTDIIYPLAGAGNVATHTIPVPNSAALIGCQLYEQGYSIDPAANAAGLVASNSVRVTIGRL